tara:strand:+ start:3272 stop:3778 length:507 start_codon:yes stop_codon:yes gene_type:complete
MVRAKKTPTFEYGIEITKPHSKQMYDHNNHVANIMKINISNVATDIWNSIVDNNINASQVDWSVYKNEKFNSPKESPITTSKEDIDGFTYEEFQRAICYTSFGSGFTMLDVQNEIRRELEYAENWRMHELYSELFDAGMVPAIEHEMVGFTSNYNKNNASYATTLKTV